MPINQMQSMKLASVNYVYKIPSRLQRKPEINPVCHHFKISKTLLTPIAKRSGRQIIVGLPRLRPGYHLLQPLKILQRNDAYILREPAAACRKSS